MKTETDFKPEHFATATLRSEPWGASATRILAAALAAVEPARAVHQALQRTGTQVRIDQRTYALDSYQRIFVVAAGKAALPMVEASVALLGDRLTGGLAITKDSGNALTQPNSLGPVELLVASHPVPDERGVTATHRIAQLLAQTNTHDLVIGLISGGGSALLTLPESGIALTDLQALTNELLACGATIDEINTLRKHLDQVKGGGLARLTAPATLITLVLSDVVGDRLDVIASGPTVPDPTSFADALAVLERYDLHDRVPAAIRDRLAAGQRGELPDTPGPDDPLFERTQTTIIASNRQAAIAAQQAAQHDGWAARLLTTAAQGEARVVGQLLASIARELATTPPDSNIEPLVSRPACVIVGGETTVTLRGDGRGGRNQELALAAIRTLAGVPNAALLTLATDGGDGPTDAAGAVVTGTTLARAVQQGLDPDACLANNDAYRFFAALDDLIRPGPTNTNVNDLTFVLVW